MSEELFWSWMIRLVEFVCGLTGTAADFFLFWGLAYALVYGTLRFTYCNQPQDWAEIKGYLRDGIKDGLYVLKCWVSEKAIELKRKDRG